MIAQMNKYGAATNKNLNMDITSKLFMLIILFLFVGCSSNSQAIDKISYNSVGGEAGGFANVELTKDSINGTVGNPNAKIIIKEKMRKTLWDSLAGQTSLNDFKKIKSGRSVTYIDGIDVSVKIETGEESYTLLNGDINEVQNKKVFRFMQILENELRSIYLKKNH